MRALPGEPAQHVRLPLEIGGPESFLGMLRRDVEQDRVRFPEDEPVILERRHLLVGIEREISWRQLVAAPEVDRHHLAIECQVVLERDDADHAPRDRKEVKLHRATYAMRFAYST